MFKVSAFPLCLSDLLLSVGLPVCLPVASCLIYIISLVLSNTIEVSKKNAEVFLFFILKIEVDLTCDMRLTNKMILDDGVSLGQLCGMQFFNFCQRKN